MAKWDKNVRIYMSRLCDSVSGRLHLYRTDSAIRMYLDKKELLYATESGTLFTLRNVEEALEEYVSSNSHVCVYKSGTLIQLFSFMDKKTGRRTLDKIKDKITGSDHKRVYMARIMSDRERRKTNIINAYYRSNNPVERQISNLSDSPFIIDGRICASIEGFYQGIRRSEEDKQNHIFMCYGMDAKNQSTPTKQVYFSGNKYVAGSEEHLDLIFKAQLCKYTQHEESRNALLSTGDARITHKVARDSNMYPAEIYCRHLTKIRSMLKRKYR